MFGLFKKKKQEPENLEFTYDHVMVDMHSHVLPGIDDGAQTVEESVALVRRMASLGIKKIIATPHIMAGFYNNTPESINAALKLLRDELAAQNIQMEVEAAAEHYFDDTFENRVERGELMLMGDKYVLFELSYVSAPPNLIEMIKKMRAKGYKPILAHPERYSYLTLEDCIQIREWGCQLQLNTISLAGYYGDGCRQRAEDLIDNKIVDFISSDMHHTRHADAFESALSEPYLKKLLFEQQLLSNIQLL